MASWAYHLALQLSGPVCDSTVVLGEFNLLRFHRVSVYVCVCALCLRE